MHSKWRAVVSFSRESCSAKSQCIRRLVARRSQAVANYLSAGGIIYHISWYLKFFAYPASLGEAVNWRASVPARRESSGALSNEIISNKCRNEISKYISMPSALSSSGAEH